MFAPAQKLDSVVVMVDYNKWQATGRSQEVMHLDPLIDKWRAFGWETLEIDGNDMDAIVGALAAARNRNGMPKAIVLRTVPGRGVRRIESSEKSHFFRVDVSQWDSIIAEFEQSVGVGA